MNVLAVIGEPRRQAILELVWDRERAAGEVHAELADITFGAVSQHLRVLRESGLVTVRKEGRRRFYRADKAALGPAVALLEAMWDSKSEELATLARQKDRRRRERSRHG